MNAVLYLRYSSDRQTEQSIEGQRRVCEEFCRREGYDIIAEYVDRATSAMKDVEKRTSFLRMIKDSEKRKFQAVVVYKLDRFARNRYDSATYKTKLKANGVRVVSATENISDNPEGIILESVLEGMAEFYSKELSQKITRGIRESALKGNAIGGVGVFGYDVKNKKFVINEAEAAVIREAFRLYAVGTPIKEIVQAFNEKGYRTKTGTEFNKSTIYNIFHNEKYIGVYQVKDIRIEGGVPAIVSKELFNRCRVISDMFKHNPSRGNETTPYILSGKCYCGHCGSLLIADAGTGKKGKKYFYYSCTNHKHKHCCEKRRIRKDTLEALVVRDLMSFLDEEGINDIAEKTVRAYRNRSAADTELPVLRDELEDVQKKIKNLIKLAESGIVSDDLGERLAALEDEKKALSLRIDSIENMALRITEDQVSFWLHQNIEGDVDDIYFKRRLIENLVSSISVWDGENGNLVLEIWLNVTGEPIRTIVDERKNLIQVEDDSPLLYDNLYAIRTDHMVKEPERTYAV